MDEEQNKAETTRILTEVSVLLRRYGYDERSSFVAAVASAPESEAFWATVAGLEFWGGSGAVWEVEPFGLSHPGADAAPQDYRRFRRLLIDLAEMLQAKGLSDLAARNAELFRRELAHDD